MRDLIAICYPDEATARDVRDRLVEQQLGPALDVEDIVILTRAEDGKVKHHQGQKSHSRGCGGRCSVGTLIGLVFLAPLLRTVVGGATRAAAGALTDLHR